MKLGEIPVPPGATHRRKRRGFGESSGHGKTSGRGTKGQRARSGHGLKPGFEGGQMPLIRRIPKRGFTHVRSRPIAIINVKELNRFEEGSVVSPELFLEKGLVQSKKMLIKILGDGALERKLTVRAHRFSKSAQEKITAAGGQVEAIPC